MFRRALCTVVALAVFAAARAHATNVQLSLSIDFAAQTWKVGMSMADAQNLGLSSFSIDVLGTGGVSIQKTSIASQTNASPSTVFTQLRSTGTLNGSNLIGLAASQDVIGAVNNNDDSALGYGFGLPSQAVGTFTGPVAAQPMTLAQGRWTLDPNATDPIISAQLTAASFFTEFPLNWDANDLPPPAGSSQSQIAASVVAPASQHLFVPEPSTIVLLACGGLAWTIVRHRKLRRMA